MKQKLQIKPSKPAGAVQMMGGIVFVIIGVTVIIPMLVKSNGPVWFGLLWTCGAAVIATIGAVNAFSDKGVPTEEIISETDDVLNAKSTEDRLRELDSMRQKQLISESEYAATRKRILDEH